MIINDRTLWSVLKTRNVTVSVKPKHDEICMACRIVSSIDTGNGKQRVVLKSVGKAGLAEKRARLRYDLSMPAQIGSLECIYTQAGVPLRGNVYKMIAENHPGSRIEMIVPEVAAPGDYLVYRKPSAENGITVIEALRVIQKAQYERRKTDNAL